MVMRRTSFKDINSFMSLKVWLWPKGFQINRYVNVPIDLFSRIGLSQMMVNDQIWSMVPNILCASSGFEPALSCMGKVIWAFQYFRCARNTMFLFKALFFFSYSILGKKKIIIYPSNHIIVGELIEYKEQVWKV